MTTLVIPVRDYDLAETLISGQAFRWTLHEDGWHGVIGSRIVILNSGNSSITAKTSSGDSGGSWLTEYLQAHLDLDEILSSFPDDPPMRAAVAACRGLRLLRQDPWECLASFILSSTKQIVQIRQIVSSLCDCFGERLSDAVCAFPSAERLAQASEPGLRACKMGFRAPYLLSAARCVSEGRLNLHTLGSLPLDEARAKLMTLKGVGRKIADCVLLFAYGYPAAFPVDVWVMKALRELYFPHRQRSAKQLRNFSETHFGPNAGYAQQYLFHYRRTRFSSFDSPMK